MKNYMLALFFLPVAACQGPGHGKSSTDIKVPEDWEFSQAGKDHWLPAHVPGTVHTDLLNNGVIEDPFFRKNEHSLQWIDKLDWEYRTTIEVDEDFCRKRRQRIVFKGLDTYADVFINDELVLRADNMFREWEVDIKGLVRPGRNSLRIVLRSPVMTGLEKLGAHGFPLPASNDQSENGEMGEQKVSPFVRKAPYHFGWDWGPRLVTSGIWRPVSLEAWDGPVIGDVFIRTLGISEGRAEMKVEVKVEINDGNKLSARIYHDGKLLNEWPLERESKGESKGVHFILKDPVLWWPNGMGEPAMTRFNLEIVSEGKVADKREITTGIRTIEMIRQPDSLGESFYFRINGVPFFAKGANYIPNDVFLPRITAGQYETIVRSAAEAHMNMLRVWGGGIYEDDLFYELCDKHGILVWQDFMFACSMYPGNTEFLVSVEREAEDNIRRLRNHPCIALWCGNNEIEVAWAEGQEGSGWGWKEGYDRQQRRQIWQAYDTLFHHILPRTVAKFDPGKPYWPSSPSAGNGQLASHANASGDMHYWGVWHGLEPISDFRKYRARFMSEYGFQSFPEFSSVKRYAIPEDWNISSDVMKSHQRSGIGNLRIRQYMEADFPVPEDFSGFLYVGQLLQAEAIRTAIESHRADMPYCMGSLYWQINDCWPVASWSGIDYYGKWKALHYAVREAFKPVALVIREQDGTIVCRIVSDKPEEVIGQLQLFLLDFLGNKLWTETREIQAGPMSSTLVFEAKQGEILKNADPRGVFLLAELFRSDSLIDQGIHYFVRPKDLLLTDPALEIAVTEVGDDFLVKVKSKALAKNVFLSAKDFGGRFSDNFFDVLPGKVASITYKKEETLEEFKSRLSALHLYNTVPLK